MLKLDLGSGFQKMDGFTTVDVCQTGVVDILHDIETRLPFEDSSVDEIYSSHSLEHCKMSSVPIMLRDWNRVLKTGGKVYIIVPEFTNCLQTFLNATEETRWDTPIEYIYGAQDNKTGQQLHKSGYTPVRLKKLLEESDFIIDTLDIINNGCADCIHLSAHKK